MNEIYTPPERGRKPSELWGKSALALSLLALILAAAALYWALPRPEPEQPVPDPPPEPETILYRGQELPILEDVARSEYAPGDFSPAANGWLTYEKDGKKAAAGIDVSFYQGEIDWEQVAAAGVDFAIIRLGYRGYSKGALQPDSKFEQNIQGALDAGLEVGVYFFSQAVTPEEAEAEAAYIINVIEGYEITYPVAFDWEPIAPGNNARTDGLDNDVLTQCAAAFCEKIRGAGYTPAIYFNQSLGYLRYDLRELTEYNLWLAEYDVKPDFYYHFDLWQYTHTGKVAGIEGEVDLDLDLR